MAFKGAIFDMDGTLLDSMGMWSGLCRNFLKLHGIDLVGDIEAKLEVLSLRDALEYILAHYPVNETLEAACSRVWRMVEDFYRTEVELKPGVREILGTLADNGIPAGIVTATEPELAAVALRKVGLEDRFSAGVTSCVPLRTSKRRPDVFLMTAEKLNAAPSEIIVFEDALYAGRTAKEAGFALAAVFDPSEKDPGSLAAISDWYCRSWLDFPLEVLRKPLKI